tara:strand:+ start:495 stop:731 length:237 start_codon:yes stop_codon:yes gene_type:complete
MNIKVNSQKVRKEGNKYYYLKDKNKIFIDGFELLLKFHKKRKNVNYIVDMKIKKGTQDGGDMKVINLNGSNNSQSGGG